MNFLRTMFDRYDDGNCKSFFCLASTLLSLKNLNESLVKTDLIIQERSIGEEDRRSKAKILKEILQQFAAEENEELKLRKVRNA